MRGRCAITWVAVAVSVGTAIVGGYEQHQVAKKQDSQLAAQIRQQGASRDKVAQRNAQFIAQQQGQTDKPQETAAAKQYDQALTANKTNAVQPLQTVGAVSDAYKKSGSDAALGIADYGKNLGNLTAAIDAPTQQRRDNQRNIAEWQTGVGNTNRTQQGNNFLDEMKLNSIHANPYIGLLMSVANGYAKAKGGGGSFGGGSTDAAGGYDSMPDYSGYA